MAQGSNKGEEEDIEGREIRAQYRMNIPADAMNNYTCTNRY